MSTPLIVFLDRDTLPTALPPLAAAHRWREFAATRPEERLAHAQDAEVLITNKVVFDRATLEALPQLKLIAVAATGYNIIDTQVCQERGIAVCNVPAYSTQGVAEHTLMLMLALRHRLGQYAGEAVHWPAASQFCIFGPAIGELAGATLTLIGGGTIGQRVATLAQAFGMTVLRAEHRGAATIRPSYTDFETALAAADIVSLHCPLTAETRHLIGAAELARLKPGAVLINTARGGIVDEAALAASLARGELAGAGLDVLSSEPPPAAHPLLQLEHPNLIITPHIAWASEPSLQRLARVLIGNIDAFLLGAPQNRVA